MKNKHTFEELEVTPEQAKIWLTYHNEGNRWIKPNAVKHYSRMMKEGTWGGTNVAVFDNTGNLIDGQHRLSAVVECGIPQVFQIIKGAERKAQNYFDTGKPRTSADALSMSGSTKNQTFIAAGLMLHYHWMDGKMTSHVCSGTANLGLRTIHASERNSLLQRLYEQDPDEIQQIIKTAQQLRKKFQILNMTAVFAFLYRAKQKLVLEQAYMFLSSALDGTDLPETDSRRAMIASLMKLSGAKYSQRKATVILCLLVNFFNKRDKEVRNTLIKFNQCPDLVV